MKGEALIRRCAEFVQRTLKNAEGGHDWFHIQRVFNTSKMILQEEMAADSTVVKLAALSHDIADPKFHQGDESIGPAMAQRFLEEEGVKRELIDRVVEIVKGMSYRNSLDKIPRKNPSLEFQIVQDADRLDAMGAIGIARAFSYGGHKNRALYDPNVPYKKGMTKEEYKNSGAPTINHFHEKLLLLKDGMHTKVAKRMALERHAFMLEFLERFHSEWEGK